MTSHHRPGLLAKFRFRRAAKAPIFSQRPGIGPSIELVDGLTRVSHRVTSEELLAGRLPGGSCTALCGVRVLAASLTDPGRGRCPECTP
jgi:hypothetical protein